VFATTDALSEIVVEQHRSPLWRTARNFNFTSTTIASAVTVHRRFCAQSRLWGDEDKLLAGVVEIDDALEDDDTVMESDDLLKLNRLTYDRCLRHLEFLNDVTHNTVKLLPPSLEAIRGPLLDTASVDVIRAAAKTLKVALPAANCKPSEYSDFVAKLRSARDGRIVATSLLEDHLSNIASNFPGTRAMEAGLAQENKIRALLPAFLKEYGISEDNIFRHVVVRGDFGLVRNKLFARAMTTSDGDVVYGPRMRQAGDEKYVAALELKTLDSTLEIKKSRDFATKTGTRVLAIDVSYSMTQDSRDALITACNGDTGHFVQCLNHAAVLGHAQTIYCHLDGRGGSGIIRAVIFVFHPDVLLSHCRLSHVLSSRFRPWENYSEAKAELPKGFIKEEVQVAMSLSEKIGQRSPHVGAKTILKPTIVALHNVLKTTQDTAKRESKLFRPISQGRGPIFQILTELVAMSIVASIRVNKAFIVASSADFSVAKLPSNVRGIQDKLNNLGSNVTLFHNAVRNGREKLMAGLSTSLTPGVELSGVVPLTSGIIQLLRSDGALHALRALYRSVDHMDRQAYMQKVMFAIEQARKSPSGLLSAYNQPLLASFRLLDNGFDHTPFTVARQDRRQSVCDCIGCDLAAEAGLPGSCKRRLKTTTQTVCRACGHVPLSTVPRQFYGYLSAFEYFHNAPVLQEHPFYLEASSSPLFSAGITDSSKKRRKKRRIIGEVPKLSSFDTPV